MFVNVLVTHFLPTPIPSSEAWISSGGNWSHPSCLPACLLAALSHWLPLIYVRKCVGYPFLPTPIPSSEGWISNGE